MATQLLIYERVIPISKQRHANWSIKAGDNYAFAKSINSVPLVIAEFHNAAPEYPIVFAGSENHKMPVAILGIRDQENLYLDADNHWRGTYIPAFIRRYPYVFSQSQDGLRYMLCIDEDYAGCNQDNRGERLFDADGEYTHYLKHTLRFVNEYQSQLIRTQNFCEKLEKLNLLEPMQAQFSFTSGQKLRLTGFFAVDYDRFNKLKEDQVADLFKTRELELIYLHLHSMHNFNMLVDREMIHIKAENPITKISNAVFSKKLH